MIFRAWCVEIASYIILSFVILLAGTILLYIVGVEFYPPLRWHIPHAIHGLWDLMSYARDLFYDSAYAGQVIHGHIEP